MSEHLCPIVLVEKIEAHPNADMLEIAHILGYQCIVSKKDNWKVGDVGVFFPPDSVVPVEHPDFAFLTPKSHNGKFRIRTIKLRGTISQGLLIRPTVQELNNLDAAVKAQPCMIGVNIAHLFNAEKYEPPVDPVTGVKLGGKTRSNLPEWLKPRYDVERFQNYPNYFYGEDYQQPPFSWFIATEKLEGTNVSYSWREGKFQVFSHNFEKAYPEDPSVYSEVAKSHDMENILKNSKENDIILQGEIVGPGIQGNIYKLTEPRVYFFDVKLNGQYVDYGTFMQVIDSLGLRRVPVVYDGKLLPKEEMVAFSNGKSALADTKREGLVWRCHVEKPSRFGRSLLKIISPEYDLKRG